MIRLRVALDGRPLQSDPLGGVGRYIAGLLPLLAKEVEASVLLDARRALPRVGLGGAQPVPLSAPVGLPGLGWLELAVAPWLNRRGGLFHGTFNVLPLRFRGPSVLTLHDLAPQLHPEDFRPDRRVTWRLNMRASVRRARRITTVSEFSQAQIVEYFGLPPGRVVVARDAVDRLFSPERAAGAAELVRSLGIQSPYVVALGGAPRRGLPVAIEAWRLVNEQLRAANGPQVTLAVLGQPDLAPEPGVVSLRPLDDEDWASLLAGARALCYPTRYEGFGLPALEAAASGTPVVCARVASLPEVLGEAGCWATSPAPEPMATAMHRVLSDPAWHRQQREAGLERARTAPSFSDVAQVLLEAYQDSLSAR